jgi:hypothetical protein
LLLVLLWRSGIGHGMTSDWMNLRAKFLWLEMALRDRWQFIDMLSVALPLTLLVFAWRRPELTLSRNLAFSALVLLVVFLLLPRIVFGSAYADMRLLPFVIATALLGIRFAGATDPRMARALALFGLGFYVARIALTTASLAMASNSQAARLAALDHVPRGASMVHLVERNCAMSWELPRNIHLGAMAIVRRHAFSNDQWVIPGVNLLTVRYAKAGEFRGDPSQVVRPLGCHPSQGLTLEQSIRSIPPGAFDYLWLIDTQPANPQLLARMTLVWSGPGSNLYRSGGPPQDVTLGPQQATDHR